MSEKADDNTIEKYQDSPPTSPLYEIPDDNEDEDLLSDSSEDRLKSKNSPPSSPLRRRHGTKRPSYFSYREDPSQPIPRQTLERWKKRRIYAEAIAQISESDAEDDSDDTRIETGRTPGEADHTNCDDVSDEERDIVSHNLDVHREANEEQDPQDTSNLHSDSSVASISDGNVSQSSSSNDSGPSCDSERESIDDSDLFDREGNHSDNFLGSSGSESEVDDDIHTDMFDDKMLYPGCEKTTDEAVYELLTIYLSNNLSNSSLCDILRYYISSLPSNHNMPRSTVHFINYVDSLSMPLDEVEHFYCRPAMHIVNIREGPCSVCDSTDIGVFYELPLQSRIQFLFEQRGLADLIDKYVEEKSHHTNDGCLHDVVDGLEYSRVWSAADGNVSSYKITLILNTDGVSPNESSGAKMWPLMYSIMEVPPHLRSSFIIVWGIWFDKQQKPDMSLYLRPFVTALVKTNESGGISWKHPDTGANHLSPVRAPDIVADAPARAALLNMQEHQAKYACNACEQKTSKLPIQPVALGQRRLLRRKRRFLFKEEAATLRTHESIIGCGRYTSENGSGPKKGIKGLTVIQDIPSIDLSTCVHAEYMHCVLLGVVKQICSLWFFEHGGWYIGNHMTEISNFLCNQINPPDFVSRLPRSLRFFSYFKANEFRSFFLYYSLIAVAPYQEDRYLQHWMLLVQAIFSLLTESISEDDLVAAEAMIRLFVRDVGRLYGEDKYVYNFHQLTHLVLYVRRWGNLWANSAFCFENFNGILSRMIHGTKNEGRELMNRMKIAQGAQMLRNKMARDSDKNQNNFEPFICNPLITYVPTQQESDLFKELNIDLATVQFFGRIKIAREQYSSQAYDKTFKRRNSYVEVTSNGQKNRAG